MDATLVIPALNEEESLGYVLKAVDTDLLSEIILVDGGSSDRTVEIAELNGVRVIQESRRGYGRACATEVANAQGEVIIFMDADGADDPSQIPNLMTPIIQDWQEMGERVVMIGDGINDAPALAQADLSITVMGGTAIAGETSDVVLMQPDLFLVPWFIDASRRTSRIIRQNLGWAFLYNVVTIPLASLGLISPMIAAITMACSSLLVLVNSLRLKNI